MKGIARSACEVAMRLLILTDLSFVAFEFSAQVSFLPEARNHLSAGIPASVPVVELPVENSVIRARFKSKKVC